MQGMISTAVGQAQPEGRRKRDAVGKESRHVIGALVAL